MADSAPFCPSERIWDEISTGLIKSDEALPFLRHASTCPACAHALKLAVEVFEPENRDVETPVVELQRLLKNRWAPAKWIAIAALLVVTTAATYLFWMSRERLDPVQMLAQEYSSHRTIELRLPGAAYGAIRVERGVRGEPSPDFFDAEASIARALKRDPRDQKALRAKGRLELLRHQPWEAIAALEGLKVSSPSSPDVLTELAIAYYELGSTDHKRRAIDLLSEALGEDSTNAAALFNRGVIEVDVGLSSEAARDLTRLLELEPASSWAEETKARLARIRGLAP